MTEDSLQRSHVTQLAPVPTIDNPVHALRFHYYKSILILSYYYFYYYYFNYYFNIIILFYYYNYYFNIIILFYYFNYYFNIIILFYYFNYYFNIILLLLIYYPILCLCNPSALPRAYFPSNRLCSLFFSPYMSLRYAHLQPLINMMILTNIWCGPDSSVGIATEIRADRSGDRIPVGARYSACPDRPWGPPTLLYNGYRVFPGGKVRPGRAAHSPPSSAVVLEE